MASLTKSQLAAQLEQSHVSYQKLQDKLTALEAVFERATTPTGVAPITTKSSIPTAHCECGKCGGTGQYLDFGICYQCEGTGTQSVEDQKRNWGYNRFHTAKPAAPVDKPSYVPYERKPFVRSAAQEAARAKAMATGQATLV